ncbi:hypothetical protein F3Y22_tig00005929pilonHSYRG00015 [Hibiscus syriacus]|uniref:WRKY domain-containing protein n=1 Tax=Hibiscus syriacus TaxID=106335 RepID=A0A6A3CHL0_HIBSY|nr:probable WRKY transcription factor 27 [Hibiscus syriacus]KAE8726992.1 hypothetical protein F3Y22_tig00005929pilonHSYRG00015 [Hibiscus syriacus]
MAAEWDLFAVVRSCKSTRNTASSSVATNLSSKGNSSGCNDDPLAYLPSLAVEQEADPFPFPNQSKSGSYRSLRDSQEPVLTQADPTIVGNYRGGDPCFLGPVEGGYIGQHYRLQHQLLLQQQQQFAVKTNLAPVFTFDQFLNQSPPRPKKSRKRVVQLQHHQFQQQQQQEPATITTSRVPVFTCGQIVNQRPPQPKRSKKRVQHPEVPRLRRRRNQPSTVCHVTGDNLSTDQWSWRKYGQKPIKGSPNPRHYYRCSNSKGCSARKHVERSSLDPDSFIVAYTDEHTHSKPTRRSKLSKAAANVSSSSFISPTTPLSAPEDGDAADTMQNAGDNGVKEGENDKNRALETPPVVEIDDDEDVILIPNSHVNEDLLERMGELLGGAGGSSSSGSGLEPNWPAFGGNFSSWCSGNSASGGTAGRG